MLFRRRPRFTFDDLAALAEADIRRMQEFRKKAQAGISNEKLEASGLVEIERGPSQPTGTAAPRGQSRPAPGGAMR
jgi:hypothetical protein